jgi:hypothetical protein
MQNTTTGASGNCNSGTSVSRWGKCVQNVEMELWHEPQNWITFQRGLLFTYSSHVPRWEAHVCSLKTHLRLDMRRPSRNKIKNKYIRGATALTNLGRLSSRRWQSFPTSPDGYGLTCGQHIESHSYIFSFQNPTVTSLFK